MKMCWSIALLVAVALPASAQVRGGRGFGISFAPTVPTSVPGVIPNNVFLGAPYFYPSYAVESVGIQAQPPQVVVVQVPAAAAAAETPKEAKPDALLIEWRGDHYARIAEASGRSMDVPLDYSERDGSSAMSAARPSGETSPVVIVFRDGRREAVKSYTIVGAVMYVAADGWQGGSWTKKVQLASLDMAGTVRVNQEHGVRFVLPAGPNEVVASF